MDRTDRLLKQLVRNPQASRADFGNVVVPNHSGDHSKGIVRDAPETDVQIVNKKYVDDLTANHPHQDVNTTASPRFVAGRFGTDTATTRTLQVLGTTAGSQAAAIYGADYVLGLYSGSTAANRYALYVATGSNADGSGGIQRFNVWCDGNVSIGAQGNSSPSEKLNVIGSGSGYVASFRKGALQWTNPADVQIGKFSFNDSNGTFTLYNSAGTVEGVYLTSRIASGYQNHFINTTKFGTSAAYPGNALLYATGSGFPVLETERTTSSTNSRYSGMLLLTTSSGNMADGFGGGFVLGIQDTAAVKNNIAAVYGVRDGADDSGKLLFDVWSAGTQATRASIDKNGLLTVNGQTLSEVPTNNTAGYKLKSGSGYEWKLITQDNYLSNKFIIRMDSTNKVFIDSSGVVDAVGGFSVNGSAGASGSFTTTDGKTVTVTNGIITSIV